MKSVRFRFAEMPTKDPTCVTGFDEITGGGLPRRRTEQLVGGLGSGKRIFALLSLVHSAQEARSQPSSSFLKIYYDGCEKLQRSSGSLRR